MVEKAAGLLLVATLGGTVVLGQGGPPKRPGVSTPGIKIPIERLKPEAVFEVEQGAKVTAYQISAASMVRTQWYEAVRKFFERYDFWILPTAQLFPFDVNLDWPHEIAGRTMTTYHEWMKVVLPVTMSGCPVLAAPAGFGANGLPIGLQIGARNHAERDCLELGHAYDRRTNWTTRRPSL